MIICDPQTVSEFSEPRFIYHNAYFNFTYYDCHSRKILFWCEFVFYSSMELSLTILILVHLSKFNVTTQNMILIC